MTVAIDYAPSTAAYSGAETNFPTGVRVRDAGDLVVKMKNADLSESILTRNVHYSVSVSPEKLATVSKIAFPYGSGTLNFSRATPFRQPVSFAGGTSYPPETHEAMHDEDVLRQQEMKYEIDRLDAVYQAMVAAELQGNALSFTSRALAQSANIPIVVMQISVLHSRLLLRYVRDSNGTALVTADGSKWSPAETPMPLHWGAVGDALSDDILPVQAAIDWVGSAKPYRGGMLQLGAYRYRCTDRVIFDQRGVICAGVAFSATGTDDSPSQIIGDHDLGEVVSRQASNVILECFTITSSEERWTPPADGSPQQTGTGYGRYGFNGRPNVGLRTEGPDVSGGGGYVQGNGTRCLTIRHQPFHADIEIGENSGSWNDHPVYYRCNGHGLVYSNGEEFGRANPSPPGICITNQGKARDIAGHGFAVGHPDQTTASAYRVDFINFETFNGATDDTILLDDADCFLFGQDCTLKNSGIGAVGKRALSYAGRDNIFENNRYFFLHSMGAAIQRKYAIDATRGNIFKGMTLFPRDESNVSVPTCEYVINDDDTATTSPYVILRTGNPGTEVYSRILSRGDRSAWTQDNSATKSGAHILASGFASSRPIYIVNGGIYSIDMGATGGGLLDIFVSTVSTAGGTINFRTGSSPFCTRSTEGPGAADIETKTGALATFSDGNNLKLTVSTHTDNKLYFLNRLGAPIYLTIMLKCMIENQRIPWSVIDA